MVGLWLIEGYVFGNSRFPSLRKHSHTPVKHTENKARLSVYRNWKRCADRGADLSVLGSELLNQLLKGCKFLPVNQIKLLNKEDKVLERGVEMRLLLQLDY